MGHEKNEPTNKLLSLIPKIAKSIGEHTVNAACVFWMNQPKIPRSMLKKP